LDHLIIGALAVTLVLLVVAFIVVVRALARGADMADQRAETAEQRADAAEDRAARAPKRSHDVNMGKIGQHFAAFLPGFPYNLKDVQWVGGKVDAIVWNGLDKAKSGCALSDELEIVLLEVKIGEHADLDRDQRLIRKAAKAGRVRFDVFEYRPRPRTAVSPVDVMASSELTLPNGDTDSGARSQASANPEAVGG